MRLVQVLALCAITSVSSIAVLAAFVVVPALAEAINFAGETAGAPPRQFDFARTGQGGAAHWVLVRDASADGGMALEQDSQETTDYRFPLAIYQPVSARNVEVRIRFKAMSGKVDRAGGIALRLTSPDDYYVVRANALEDNVRFYRVVRGKREQLATANVRVPANEWHVLGLKADRDRFTISFKGKELYAVTDKTFDAAGRIAFWTKADSVTRFDRLDINLLP
jgi:hypothetical protein